MAAESVQSRLAAGAAASPSTRSPRTLAVRARFVTNPPIVRWPARSTTVERARFHPASSRLGFYSGSSATVVHPGISFRLELRPVGPNLRFVSLHSAWVLPSPRVVAALASVRCDAPQLPKVCDRKLTQLPQELVRLTSVEVAGSAQQRHRIRRPSHRPPCEFCQCAVPIITVPFPMRHWRQYAAS